MRVDATTTDGLAGTPWFEVQAPYTTSPFTAGSVSGVTVAATELELESFPQLVTPFAQALASYDEVALEDEAFEALMAELEDEDFAEALDAVANEVAGRHLAATDGCAPRWSGAGWPSTPTRSSSPRPTPTRSRPCARGS